MHKTFDPNAVEKNLAAIGWGLFFVWVGAALLGGLNEGIGLLGIGVITLGMQAARKLFDLKLEGFWLVVGALFALGGIWTLYDISVGLLPLVLLAAGLLLLISTLWRKS